MGFEAGSITYVIICKHHYTSLYQQIFMYVYMYTYMYTHSFPFGLDVIYAGWVLPKVCPVLSHFGVLPRASPSGPRDDARSLSRWTSPQSCEHECQLPVGSFPDTRSHISQASAEDGGLELRKGVIWMPGSASGPRGAALGVRVGTIARDGLRV